MLPLCSAPSVWSLIPLCSPDTELGVDPASLSATNGVRYSPAAISGLVNIARVIADDGRSAAIGYNGSIYLFGDFPAYMGIAQYIPTLLPTAPGYKVRSGCLRKSAFTSSFRAMVVAQNGTQFGLFAAGDNFDGELLFLNQVTRVSELTESKALAEVTGKTVVQVVCSDESTTVLTGMNTFHLVSLLC